MTKVCDIKVEKNGNFITNDVGKLINLNDLSNKINKKVYTSDEIVFTANDAARLMENHAEEMSKVINKIVNDIKIEKNDEYLRLTVYIGLNTEQATRKHIAFKINEMDVREVGPALIMLGQSLIEHDSELLKKEIQKRSDQLV